MRSFGSPRTVRAILAWAGLALGVAACGRSGAWLEDATQKLGIAFTHSSGGTGQMYLPEIIGGGVALFDYDSDGDLDLYLVNSNKDVPGFGRTGEVVNQLFRHEADGTFTDVTASSGLGDNGYGMGVAVGDFDNDGHPDVYVTNMGPDQLYHNQGDGSFANVTAAQGIDVPGWSASAAFCDYDRDGFLDLFVTQYLKFDPQQRCTDLAGQPEYCGPQSFQPVHSVLLHNDGGRHFTEVSGPAGIAATAGAAMGVACRDLTGDGWQDFYVTNDSYANNLWVNQHDGTFVDQAVPLGAALGSRSEPRAGMGLAVADFTDDGQQDLLVTNLKGEGNAFYRRAGELGFEFQSEASGLAAPSLSYTGFGVTGVDLDLDGSLDVAVANGRVKGYDPLSGARQPAPWNRLAEPNQIFHNDGQGHFTPLSPAQCGPFCDAVEISRGLAHGDLDGDGAEDLVVTNTEGPARVYLNRAPQRGHWLSVRTLDPRYQRDAPGTVVTATLSARQLVRVADPATSYLSSSAPDAHFGLGQADQVDRLAVQWPDGLVERFTADCVDCRLILRRGEGQAR